MSIEEEIKKRLNNPENDFPTNLLYGIQLWKSKSFYYLAKYEIVTNFFSSNLLEFYKSIRKHSKDDFNEKWTIVNEFLSLDCPLGALSKSQHTNITEIIPKVASKSLKRPKRKILDSFMIIALNQRYKNFHKYDIENYGILMKDCLKYYKTILQQSLNISKDEEENQTKSILNDLNLYVKVGSNVEEMRDRFYKSIIIDLSEVVLVLKSLNIYVFDDLISILKELYFSEGKSSDYYRIEKDKSHLFMRRFDVAAVPVHILAILIEGYVVAYKSSKADLMNFTKYLFTSIFVDVETSTLKSITDIFSIISAYFRILKKYFVKIEQILLQEYDFMRLIPMKVQEMFDRYKTNSDVLCGIFSLISTIIDYNPLILEKEIINMVIQFMFIQKNGELSMELYQNMILSTIDLFTKLNRKEQFRTELFSKLDDFFDANDSSKLITDLKLSTLKRTHTDELTVASKKLKLDNMDDSSSITVDIFEKEPLDYMKLLTKTGKKEISSKSESSHNELFDEWTGIAFAWPDKNGKLKNSMINYIASQRSKMNFNFLYNLRENLTELLPFLIKDQHESYFFKLDLFCCFLCYFFNGNAMVEQSNLYWDKLQAEMDKFDECMTNFGQIIVKTNCDRIICAFLKLAYSYENFKMVVYYYHPDSIQNVNIKRPNSYLTGKDWQIIETKSTTNKKEWNRLKVARLRFSEMFENTQHSLNELDSFENLKHVLLDKATNYWLIKQLTNDQKIQVSHEILDNFTDKEAILFIIRKLFNDQEFVSIFIVAIFEKLSKLIENSSIGKLNFVDCYTMNEDVVLKKVSKLIKKRCDFVVEDENSSKIENILTVLAGIQINEMKAEYKNVIIGLGFLLLFDLKANENGQLTKKLKNILMVQIKFGKFPDICKYLAADVVLQIFSPIDGQNKEFVQCLFQQIIFHMTRNSMDMQKNILAKFKVDRNPNLFKLVITSSEYLVKVNSSYLKEVTKEEIKELVDEYMQAIIEFTEENANHPSDECLYGLTLVIRHLKNHNMEFSESIQQNFEKYLNYSLSNSSVWTSTFLTNALNYESQFKLSEDKIVEIIENRWEEFKYLITKDLNDGTANDDSESVLRILNIDPLKSIANFIINNQTDAQLEERFKSIESSAKANRSSSNLKHVLRIYTTLIKKGLGKKTSKTNSVITKSIELIISEVIQPLTINSKFSDDTSCLHEILDFFDGVIQNSKIQLTPKTMDKIMEFVENINIKKHKIVNGEEKLFFKLNQQISSILYDFIVNKDFYVLNRLSQYFHVFNGVLSSIIGYKDDRNEQETLESFEILSLSDLLHPMEKIMNILVKYEKDLKLVAPYELVSIITFIITSKRSTTLHDMIKKSINNICYELISIYDKRAPAYILRTCGEAEKNIYTEMVKNYGKYKLFKGKI